MSIILQNRSHPNFPGHVMKFHLGQKSTEALQIVFEYLPYLTLRMCMVVSKTWRKLSMEELEARYSVAISSDDHTNIVLEKLCTTAHFRVSKLVISVVPLESLHVQLVLSKVRNTLNLLQIETSFRLSESLLFQVIAKLPNLTSLSVAYVLASSESKAEDKGGANDPVKFPFFGDRWITNFSALGKGKPLPTVSPRFKNYEGSANVPATFAENNRPVFPHTSIRFLLLDLGQDVTFQLSKIFYAFPCLIELAIANVRDEPLKHFKSIPSTTLSPFPPSSHQHQPELSPKLKRLSLRQYSSAGFSEKLLVTLMRFNMHLEKLELIFHPPPTSSSSTASLLSDSVQVSRSLLRQFIESQDVSLRSLKLVQVENDLCHFLSNNFTTPAMGNSNGSHSTSNYYWNFNYSSPSSSISLLPLSLSNLEVLHVQKPLISNLAQVLNHFPKLKELSLQVSYANWKGLLPSRLEPHESITKLKIDFIDSDSFSRIGFCFPSLQTLQLAFCDQSLFTVLCDLIPYFNGNSSRGRLVSCQQCHGSAQEFVVCKKNKNDDESFPRGAGALSSLSANFPGGNRSYDKSHNLEFTFPHNSSDRSSIKSKKEMSTSCATSHFNTRFNLSETLYPDYLKQQLRRKHLFKRLTLLKLRPCFHFPFENFVFLQRDKHSPSHQQGGQNFNEAKVSFGLEGEAEAESSIGFSYSSSLAAKCQEDFTELTVTSSDENNETCSTA